jgi:hypothetical protein
VITYATVMTLASLSEFAIWLHADRNGLVADTVTDDERAARRSRS